MANFAPRGGMHRDSVGQPAPQRGGGFDRPVANNDRKRMLDISREGHFRYDLREVLAKSSLPPEQIKAFAATIFSKGSRQSTVEAKDWVTQKLGENVITKTERDAINTLIDRYSKFR
ncbi:MAG TPA: hypothetical protein VFH78_04055 [Candidatus Thermoplasmatota archaeon]|nr:hypothetical protein [Candidatus Thermoplasmatota archaeon]